MDNPTVKLCECGCGEATPLARRTDARVGHIKDVPIRFVQGHQNRGRIPSTETRAKISSALSGRTLSDDHKDKLRVTSAGYSHTEEAKRKMRGTRLSARGENNNQWKGDDAGYTSLHQWVARHRTRTGTCEHCGAMPPRQGRKAGTQFANVSGEYRRDLSDYLELCSECHYRFDETKGFRDIGTRFPKRLV